MFSELTHFLDDIVERFGIPGNDCIVFHNGQAVYRRQSGFSDIENKILMNGSERYNIYSCSKILTCVAAMQLFEKGLFKLSDNLMDYLPEFRHMSVSDGKGLRAAARPITIEHLFTMTAGLTYNLTTPNIKAALRELDTLSTREVMRYIAQDPLCFDPGERWNYSLCHDVLAAFVEVVGGAKFEDIVRDNIFTPLGMQNSTFMLPENELDTIAQQYRYDQTQQKPLPCGKHISGYKLGLAYASGGAGCISTVDDFIKFLEALRIGDVIISKEMIDLMTKDRLTPTQRASYMLNGYGYGLGLRCKSAVEPDGAQDFGWGGAAGAFAAVDRKGAFSIFYAQHVLLSPAQQIRSQMTAIIRKILSSR